MQNEVNIYMFDIYKFHINFDEVMILKIYALFVFFKKTSLSYACVISFISFVTSYIRYLDYTILP